MNLSAASINRSGLQRLRRAAWLALALPVAAMAFGESDDEKPPVPADTLIPVCVSSWQKMCGLIDGQGRWAAQFTDRQLKYLDEGVWAVLKNGWTEQLLDARGQPLARLRANSRLESFSEGLAVLERSGRSYLNRRGEPVLAGPYEVAGDFHEGLAMVGKFVRGQDGGHYSLGFIDAQGREVVAQRYRGASAFRHGLAVVELDGERMGAIDRRQQMLVPAAKRLSLEVVAPERLLSRVSDERTELLDGRGRSLFGAQSIHDAGEGLAFFSNADNHLGLLDLRTGRPLVKAFAAPKDGGWQVLHPFAEGRAWLQSSREILGAPGQEPRWEKRLRLIDAQGRTVAESANWQWAQRFVNGSASVFLGETAGSLLVGRDGKPLSLSLGPLAARAGQSSSSAWPERLGAVHVFPLRDAEPTPGDDSAWVDSRGQTLFVLARLDCGIEQLRSPQGRPLWPVQDVAERCVLEAESRAQEPEAKYRAVASVERLRQLRAENEQGLDLGPEAVLRQAAGLPLSFFPLRRDGAYLSDRPGWVDGPAAIELHAPGLAGSVTLQLPAGHRYLPPAAIAAMREQDGRAAADNAGEPVWGLISADRDPQWAVRVRLLRTGRLQRPRGDELDPGRLAQTISLYDHGSPLSPGAEGMQHTTVDWLVAPQWDEARQRLSWGMNKLVLGQAKGSSASGITLVQAVQGNFSLVLNVPVNRMKAAQGMEVAQRLQVLADAAIFAPSASGEEPEAEVPRDLASLIAGHKPVEVAEFETRVGAALERDRQERAERLRYLLWRAAATLVPLLLLLSAGISRHRRRKRGIRGRRPA